MTAVDKTINKTIKQTKKYVYTDYIFNFTGILRALQYCVDSILSNNCITNKNSALHYARLEFQIQPANVDGFISDVCR